MDILQQQSLLFVYLCGIENEETNKIVLKHIDSLKYAFQEFEEEIINIHEEILDIAEDDHVMELFCIIGNREYIDSINELFSKTIQSLFQEILTGDYSSVDRLSDVDFIENTDLLHTFLFLYLKHMIYDDQIRYPISFSNEFDDTKTVCFYSNKNPNIDRSNLADSIYQIWYEIENPITYGKQVITKSFMLDDLKGRRIITHLPDYETKETYLLLEGGLKLNLRNDYPYFREKVGYSNINLYSIGDVDSIINNPPFSQSFQPYELYEDWQKVLNYVLAISCRCWYLKDIKKLHKKFMEFMEKEICDVTASKPLISPEIYYRCYLKNIHRITDYFSGKEEAVITKDYLFMLQTRFVFLPAVINIIKQVFPQASLFERQKKFRMPEYQKLLNKLDIDDHNEKGKALENIAEYLIDCSRDIQVMGKRIRTDRDEIDLSCCNISLRSDIWKLGALILIECKNWKNKVSINIIRQLGYIMTYKGNMTTILFARNGITANAQKEILRHAMLGKYILCLDMQDLDQITSEIDFENLICLKFDRLNSQIEDSIERLGV